MKHVVERAIVPYNPSASSIIQKEKYNLFAPVARKGNVGMAAFDENDFDIKNQKVSINPRIKEGITQDTDKMLEPLREDIATNTTAIATNTDNISGINATVGGLKNTVDDHEGRLSSAEAAITDITDMQEGKIVTAVNELSDEIHKKFTQLRDNTIKPLDERLTNATNKNAADIAANKTEADTRNKTLTDAVATLNEEMSTLDNELDTLNGTVATHTRNITDLNNSMNSAENTLSVHADELSRMPKFIAIELTDNKYEMRVILKDANGNELASSGYIDLPLEELIVDMKFEASTRELVLTLKNGKSLRIKVDDMFRGIYEGLDSTDTTKVMSASTGPLIVQAINNAIANRVTTTEFENTLKNYVKTEVLKDYIKTEVLDGYVTEQELENRLESFTPSGGDGPSGGNGVSDELSLIFDKVFLTNGTHGLAYGLEEIYAACMGIGIVTKVDIEIGSKVKGLPVTSVVSNAFENCTVLIESVVIPKSVTTIESFAFANNMKLKTLYINKGLSNIKANAFAGTSLSDVYYSGTESEWNSIIIGTGNGTLTNANIIYEWRG